jgi:hypothetical protein
MIPPMIPPFQEVGKHFLHTFVLPPLDGASVYVWAQSKFGVAWLANAEAIEVRNGGGKVGFGGGVRLMPEGKQELLSIDYAGVCTGLGLRFRIIDFEYLDVVGGEAWIASYVIFPMLMINMIKIFSIPLTWSALTLA